MDPGILRLTDPLEEFDVLELLGEGSYGAVYKACAKDGKSSPCAVKIMPAEDGLEELGKEISVLNECRSPFVVNFRGCYNFGGDVWIFMDYCEGGSLSDVLDATQTTLTEEEIRVVCAYTCLGLDFLHSQRHLHRDIKAGNILLDGDGMAKLADFGISAEVTNSITKRKTVIGTPFWMAPEVIQENGYDGRADVWSLGITAIELAEGQPPYYHIHPMRAIFMIPGRPPPTLKEPSKWSDDLVDFVRVCLTKLPEQRPSSHELLSHPFLFDCAASLRAAAAAGAGSPLLRALLARAREPLGAFRRAQEAQSSPQDAPNGTMVASHAESPSSTLRRPSKDGGTLRAGARKAPAADGTLLRGAAASPRAESDTLVRVRPASGAANGLERIAGKYFKEEKTGTFQRRPAPQEAAASTMRRGDARRGGGGIAGIAAKYFGAPAKAAAPPAAGEREDLSTPRAARGGRGGEELAEVQARRARRGSPGVTREQLEGRLEDLEQQYEKDRRELERAYQQRRREIQSALDTMP